VPGVNDTADNLLAAIERSEKEIAPSTIFAVACILEGVPFINGSPQNTFVPGCIELSERHKVRAKLLISQLNAYVEVVHCRRRFQEWPDENEVCPRGFFDRRWYQAPFHHQLQSSGQ